MWVIIYKINKNNFKIYIKMNNKYKELKVAKFIRDYFNSNKDRSL